MTKFTECSPSKHYKTCPKYQVKKTEDFEKFFEDIKTQTDVYIVKVRDFSNENVHSPGIISKFVHYDVSSEFFREKFSFELYANGITSENVGYVSVVFLIARPFLESYYRYFEFSCVVRVIDASGENRIFRSYEFPHNSDWLAKVDSFYHPFRIDQLLERNILLRDPNDFLPGDCLTLHIDVVFRTIDDFASSFVIDYQKQEWITLPRKEEACFDIEESDSGTKYYLRLDSTLAKNLIEVSSYFQRMSETRMVERRTKRMNIPADEYPIFRKVCFLFERIWMIEVVSIDNICQMYMTADKYDIPAVVESCRGLITTLLRAENDPIVSEHVLENIPTLLQLAEVYNDVQLKENLGIFSKSNRDQGSRTLESVCDSPGTEWKLERVHKEPHLLFTFLRNSREKPRFNFYQ